VLSDDRRGSARLAPGRLNVPRDDTESGDTPPIPPFTETWDEEIRSNNPIGFDGYRPPASGEESVRTGVVRTARGELAVIESRFAAHGGTMGVAAGERIVRAYCQAWPWLCAALLGPGMPLPPPARVPPDDPVPGDAWEAVLRARHAQPAVGMGLGGLDP
jgi:hypothetical protein